MSFHLVKSEREKRFFLWTGFLLLIFGTAILFFIVYFFITLLRPASEETRTVSFSVSQGQGVNIISQNLFQEGLIRNKFIFETYVWLKKSEDEIIAGEYSFPKNITMVSLTRKLLRGPDQPRDRNITIIEGWTNEQIGKLLEEKGMGKKDEFLSLSGISGREKYMNEFVFLKDLPDSASLEGYLFPDTYRVYKDAGADELIRKMLDNFEAKIAVDLQEEILSQGKTLHEVLTLASIVEAEARSTEERKKIADIFLKRLTESMPLQSDATINYITRSGRARSTYEDIQIDSPYNTYKYRGLPPGPINNPSLDAIRAVIFPESNPYYFFLTDKKGNVYYAETSAGHQKNREKYLDL